MWPQKSPWWPCMAIETLRCVIIYDNSISAVYPRILSKKDLSIHTLFFSFIDFHATLDMFFNTCL